MSYGYAEVEAALAKAFGIRSEAMGSFRGRIQNFQRLGMVPASPGTGRKISYERDHIYKWALALELVEFGIDPRLIKFVLDSFVWHRAQRYLLGDDESKDALLVFYPNMLSSFGQYAERQIVGGLICHVVTNLSELEGWRNEPNRQLESELLTRRLGMINLGQLRRAVDEGLASDQPVETAPRRKREVS